MLRVVDVERCALLKRVGASPAQPMQDSHRLRRIPARSKSGPARPLSPMKLRLPRPWRTSVIPKLARQLNGHKEAERRMGKLLRSVAYVH
jgi:hypothetical protein